MITLQDVANIVTFIMPGYFAIQMYSLIYAKREREFSRLAIESVIYSLPIVTATNVIWQQVLQRPAVSNLDIGYATVLLATALTTGLLATFLRAHWPMTKLATRWGLGSPNEDFVKTQLLRMDVQNPRKSSVTVTLKSGKTFSGTVDRISRYAHNELSHYCFANLAWFNPATNTWDERTGSLIVGSDQVEYIETAKLS